MKPRILDCYSKAGGAPRRSTRWSSRAASFRTLTARFDGSGDRVTASLSHPQPTTGDGPRLAAGRVGLGEADARPAADKRRCKDCTAPLNRHHNRTRCDPCYFAFCSRAGSFRWEGFDQGFADFMAARGWQVIGHWPVMDAGVAS